jgi:hypothetical protein
VVGNSSVANTTVDSINIGENCPPGNINGGMRSIMAGVKTLSLTIPATSATFMPKSGGIFTGAITFASAGAFRYNADPRYQWARLPSDRGQLPPIEPGGRRPGFLLHGMNPDIRVGGSWHSITRGDIYRGGSWRTLTRGEIYKGGDWHALFNFIQPLTVAIAPSQ